MLDYNEIKKGKIIIYEKEPYEILDYHVARTQQRKPQNQVKMRNLINGRAANVVFHASDTVEEADITKKDIKFLYESKGEYLFCDVDNPSNRFSLGSDVIGDAGKFLKANCEVTSLIFEYNDEEKIIGIKLPVKMDFLIKEAPPSIKGNTSSGGNKVAVLENGTTVLVPLFIEAGETVRVNTETGEYTERVNNN